MTECCKPCTVATTCNSFYPPLLVLAGLGPRPGKTCGRFHQVSNLTPSMVPTILHFPVKKNTSKSLDMMSAMAAATARNALLLPLLLCLLSTAPVAVANVEKTIFVAPAPVPMPLAHLTLADLRIDTLTPQTPSVNTRLAARFPTPALPAGEATWLLLDGLAADQRYEVRVCWTATVRLSFHHHHHYLIDTLYLMLNTHHSSNPHPSPSVHTSCRRYSTRPP